MIVVDASVAVKWFLREPDSPQALALLRQPHKLIAPDLIRIEVHAAIVKSMRRGLLKSEDAARQMDKWRATLFKRAVFVVEHDPEYRDAGALSLEVSHPLYDCVYLAMAKALHAPLATADERLAEIARTQAVKVFAWR